MRFSIRSIDREFSPAEAAEITGVSTALQRDWRRRGILPENADGKWTRWDLNDIIKLSVMKLFSDAGIDVSKTSIVSQMAMMPTRAAISLTEGAVTFEGAELPDEEKARVRSEEHTSELQSLMRISYAVFCLQKKKKQT